LGVFGVVLVCWVCLVFVLRNVFIAGSFNFSRLASCARTLLPRVQKRCYKAERTIKIIPLCDNFTA